MMRRTTVILAFFILFSVPNLNSQSFSSSQVLKLFEKFTSNNPWEEIYLHFDRNKFIAGEDVWFSIYAADRSSGKLSARNSIAYVELINPWNTPIIQKRFELNEGKGNGSFLLPDTLSSGTYSIRAYTNWMKNYFPENCFSWDLDIFNPFRGTSIKRNVEISDNPGKAFSISFYPEGGKLFNGVETKIIARCINSSGMGVAFNGQIIDNSGNQIALLNINNSGYGKVKISPVKGQRYSVVTSEGTFFIPDAEDNGFAVSVSDQNSGETEVLLTAAGTSAEMSPEAYMFIIQSRGKIVYSSEIPINNPITRIRIPWGKLNDGINQMVLISKKGKIMLERAIYLPSTTRQQSSLNVITDSVYSFRQKVSLGLESVKNLTNLSISVSQQNLIPSSGIEDFMVFGTEYGKLPWKINDSGVSNQDRELIDNFLICSQSSWINWEKIIAGGNNSQKYLPETDGHFLSVSVKYRDKEKVDSVTHLFLSEQSKVPVFRYSDKNDDGSFSFTIPSDHRLRNLVIQPETPNDNMILEIVPSFSLNLPDSKCISEEISASELDAFSTLSFNYQTSRIYNSSFKEEMKSKSDANEWKPRFYGVPEMVIRLDDYIDLPIMQEVFFELVPGVSLKEKKSGFEMRVINPYTNSFYEKPPLMMIDGIVLNDPKYISEIDPEIVNRIEIIKTPYLIGEMLTNGIVNIITRSGNYTSFIPEYAAQLSYQVFDGSPVFRSPDYSDPKVRNSRIPDLRNTLYWNPDCKIYVDESGKIEFWTSDHAGYYVIDIEGVTSSGECVSVRKSFTVR